MKKIGCFSFLVAMAMSGDALATIYLALPTQEYVNDSSTVAHIEIVSAVTVYRKSGKNKRKCGVRYEAEVVESFKGAREHVNFYSADQTFSINQGYLVFLKAYEKPKKCKPGVSTNAEGYQVKEVCMDYDWECMKARPDMPSPIWQATSKFFPEKESGSLWITPPYAVVREEGIPFLNYKFAVVPNCKIEGECKLEKEQWDYPVPEEIRFFKGAVEWNAYRKNLIETVKPASKSL